MKFLTVQEVNWHGESIFEIRFDRNDLSFTPGDCVAFFNEKQTESRPYSIASGTGESFLRFVVRLQEGGEVSPFLATRQPGDLVYISPPFGWFRPGQPPEDDAPFVFFATGTGISPFLSHFRSRPDKPPTACLWGVRKRADAVDVDFVREHCDLTLCVSREDAPDASCSGRITECLDKTPVDSRTHYYLCGLDEMIDEVSDWLEERGVEITHVHRECFFNASYAEPESSK